MRLAYKIDGFTLVELMVVISVIGLLVGITISVLNPSVFKGRARDGVRMQDLAIIKGALEQYYAENNAYPPDIAGSLNGYLSTVPADPLSSNPPYAYCPSAGSSPQQYDLCAVMEDSRNEKNGMPSCGGGTYCLKNPF